MGIVWRIKVGGVEVWGGGKGEEEEKEEEEEEKRKWEGKKGRKRKVLIGR
jgi:hypothetical protein